MNSSCTSWWLIFTRSSALISSLAMPMLTSLSWIIISCPSTFKTTHSSADCFKFNIDYLPSETTSFSKVFIRIIFIWFHFFWLIDDKLSSPVFRQNDFYSLNYANCYEFIQLVKISYYSRQELSTNLTIHIKYGTYVPVVNWNTKIKIRIALLLFSNIVGGVCCYFSFNFFISLER